MVYKKVSQGATWLLESVHISTWYKDYLWRDSKIPGMITIRTIRNEVNPYISCIHSHHALLKKKACWITIIFLKYWKKIVWSEKKELFGCDGEPRRTKGTACNLKATIWTVKFGGENIMMCGCYQHWYSLYIWIQDE